MTAPLPTLAYTVSDALVANLRIEEMNKTIKILKEDGKWHDPAPWYMVRCSLLSVALEGPDKEQLKATLARRSGEAFYEFEIKEGRIFRSFQYERDRKWVGLSRWQKQDISQQMIDGCSMPNFTSGPSVVRLGPVVDIGWEGDWLCYRQQVMEEMTEQGGTDALHVASYLYNVINFCLADRAVHKVETLPRLPSKLAKLGIGRRTPIVLPPTQWREIVLYCPERIGNADGAGTHASPHRHYRSAHRRNQPYGPGRAQVKEITIDGVWINAEDDLDTTPLTPPTNYTLH
jgi:hypothetical protein